VAALAALPLGLVGGVPELGAAGALLIAMLMSEHFLNRGVAARAPAP
jgi:hypothetical protein